MFHFRRCSCSHFRRCFYEASCTETYSIASFTKNKLCGQTWLQRSFVCPSRLLLHYPLHITCVRSGPTPLRCFVHFSPSVTHSNRIRQRPKERDKEDFFFTSQRKRSQRSDVTSSNFFLTAIACTPTRTGSARDTAVFYSSQPQCNTKITKMPRTISHRDSDSVCRICTERTRLVVRNAYCWKSSYKIVS